MTDPRVDRVVAFYETLTAASLARLGEVYADDAHFVDPYNDVSGLPAIRRVFEHMFATLEAPRFVVRETFVRGGGCVLLWDFHFNGRSLPGATHLRFAADGRIAAHRDYWDPAHELYAHVPLLGALMRALRRRLAAR
jgi:steroid delta-isomerase